jgi:pimeloyl-ACP methyl ester carboxylesterase
MVNNKNGVFQASFLAMQPRSIQAGLRGGARGGKMTDTQTQHGAQPETGQTAGHEAWTELALDLGLVPRPAPLRRWVQSPNAGHLSGLVWGSPRSDVVLVHDLGDSSNGWDAVAIASGRDLVALDLVGHGRSSAAATIASPARQASALIDAVRSLAPTARLVVASGFGAVVALHAAIKRPAAIRAVLVVDGGTVASGASPLSDPDGFADLDDVVARLSGVAPGRHPAFVHHLAAETTAPNEAGRLHWRAQLGPVPDTYADWLSVERLGDLSVPLGVVTATDGEPLDPVVRSILQRWPTTPRLIAETDAGSAPTVGGDLAASAPVAVARAIDAFIVRLSERTDGANGS